MGCSIGVSDDIDSELDESKVDVCDCAIGERFLSRNL